MASLNALNSSQTAEVEVLVPRPVIIYTGMKLSDWKDCFVQKKEDATTATEKTSYNECLKTLLYAELCNAELVKVGNSRPNGNLAVKFTFKFSDSNCLKVFQRNSEIITVVSQVV